MNKHVDKTKEEEEKKNRSRNRYQNLNENQNELEEIEKRRRIDEETKAREKEKERIEAVTSPENNYQRQKSIDINFLLNETQKSGGDDSLRNDHQSFKIFKNTSNRSNSDDSNNSNHSNLKKEVDREEETITPLNVVFNNYSGKEKIQDAHSPEIKMEKDTKDSNSNSNSSFNSTSPNKSPRTLAGVVFGENFDNLCFSQQSQLFLSWTESLTQQQRLQIMEGLNKQIVFHQFFLQQQQQQSQQQLVSSSPHSPQLLLEKQLFQSILSSQSFSQQQQPSNHHLQQISTTFNSSMTTNLNPNSKHKANNYLHSPNPNTKALSQLENLIKLEKEKDPHTTRSSDHETFNHEFDRSNFIDFSDDSLESLKSKVYYSLFYKNFCDHFLPL